MFACLKLRHLNKVLESLDKLRSLPVPGSFSLNSDVLQSQLTMQPLFASLNYQMKIGWHLQATSKYDYGITIILK